MSTSNNQTTTSTPKKDFIETNAVILNKTKDSILIQMDKHKEKCLKFNYNVKEVLYVVKI